MFTSVSASFTVLDLSVRRLWSTDGLLFQQVKGEGKVRVNQNASNYPYNVMHTVHWLLLRKKIYHMPLGHNVLLLFFVKTKM